MKRFFYTLFALLLVFGGGQHLQAQCTPDTSMNYLGNYPEDLGTGCLGQYFEETIFITFPRDTKQVVNVSFVSFELQTSSLPNGLTATCNVPLCLWTPANTPVDDDYFYACVTISGTPSQAWNQKVTLDFEGCVQTPIGIQCGNSVEDFDLEIIQAPFANFTSSATMNSVSFTNSTNTFGNLATYYWDFGDGNTSTDTDPTHTYASVGTYYACLTATTDSCNSSKCDSVQVTSVGIEEKLSGRIAISPNPAANEVRLSASFLQNQELSLSLLNLMGQEVRKFDAFSGSQLDRSLSLQGLPGGLYLLEFRNAEGQRFLRKVLKK